MQRHAAVVGLLACLVTGYAGLSAARGEDPKLGPPEAVAPKGPVNTLKELGDALRGCWQWPPADQIQTGMELTIMLSLKRNGEIFGTRITYQSRWVSEEERALYHAALAQALSLCSPMPISESLGHAIAGRPFTIRFNDNRKQRKA